MNKLFFLIAFLFILSACHHAPEDSHPKLSYAVQDKYLKQLPSPFPPLSATEKQEDWGKEYTIGLGFAHELDLYQALTAFKRSEFLLSPDFSARKQELNYDVFLCYYLGKKYAEAVYTFETSSLRTSTPSFPAYHDLLVILYDCYIHLDQEERAQHILYLLQQNYPETAKKLALAGVLIKGDTSTLHRLSPSPPGVQNLLTPYDAQKKSPTTAKTLNALLPGAGYFYLGQPQSGVTALLLNGLFIWASTYFFEHGNIAAGAIFTSFEAGWYFGGIYGASLETKYYNERLYERLATPMMNEQKYFPILMLNYAF